MHSAGLRSASRSRSACGRAGSATAAAMAFGTAGVLAAPMDANVAKPMTAASAAADRWRRVLGMTISPAVDSFGRRLPHQDIETGDRAALFQAVPGLQIRKQERSSVADWSGRRDLNSGPL